MKSLMLFLLLAASVATAFAQSLIVNGSFESLASGWTFTGGLSIIGPPAFPAIGVDGTHVASIGGGDIPHSTLSQNFPMAPSTDYLLTLYTAAGASGPGVLGIVRVGLVDSGGNVLVSQIYANVSGDPFVKHLVPFRTSASATTATLSISDDSPNGGIAVDPSVDGVRVDRQTPSSTENLIVNGSFESPEVLIGYAHLPTDALSPWSTTDDSFEVWASADGTESVNGAQNLEILSHSAPVTVSQTVPTIPGTDYALSFYHTPRPTMDSVLSVALNSLPIAVLPETGSALTAFHWHKFTTNFTASSNFTTISFSDVSAAASGTHIDDVVFRPLPLRATIHVLQVQVCWDSVAGRLYQPQYRSELTANLWTDLGSPLPGTGGLRCITNDVPSDEPQRFFRVTMLP